MAIESRSNLYRRTIGSEGFEKVSRHPLALAIAGLGVILGPGAIIEAINLIQEGNKATGISMGIQGGVELGTAGAITFGNIKSRISRTKPPRNS